jgi:CheY-like chemotaxis protein
MDVRTPVMDGLEATRAIVREAHDGERPFIVALTASTFEEERAGILAAGCDEYLRKPFRDEALFAILTERLGVRFVMAEEPSTVKQTPPDLGALPQPLREQLAGALARLDVAAIEQVLEGIGEQAPHAHDALAPLARRFDYEAMSRLLDGRANAGGVSASPAP